MYNTNPYGQTQYKQTSVETADRGRLIILIYDHCIKWCGIAREAIESGNKLRRSQAIVKVQAGITELVCSLDMEKGGDIAINLRRLYDFYTRHLTEGNLKNSEQHVADVQSMLTSLREAWTQAVAKVRQDKTLAPQLSGAHQKSYVSMVG